MYRNYSAPVYVYTHLFDVELERGAKEIPFAGTGALICFPFLILIFSQCMCW